MSDYKEVKVASLLDRLGEKIEDILTNCHKKQDYKTAHVLRMTEELREIVHEQQKTIDTLCGKVAELIQHTETERKRRQEELEQEELEQEERDKRDEERWLAELVKEDEKLRREMDGF